MDIDSIRAEGRAGVCEPSVRTWEGTTERRVRAVVALAVAAAGVGRKEVERESVMADDVLATVASPASFLRCSSSYLSPC
jgi:hypothetical protein